MSPLTHLSKLWPSKSMVHHHDLITHLSLWIVPLDRQHRTPSSTTATPYLPCTVILGPRLLCTLVFSFIVALEEVDNKEASKDSLSFVTANNEEEEEEEDHLFLISAIKEDVDKEERGVTSSLVAVIEEVDNKEDEEDHLSSILPCLPPWVSLPLSLVVCLSFFAVCHFLDPLLSASPFLLSAS